MIVDTHCHLNHEQFREDVGEAIQRALAAEVERMIVVGFDLTSSEEAVRLASAYPPLFAAVGVHPHEARHYSEEAESRLRELARMQKVVAVGEIGLDYHYDFSSPAAQLPAFRSQLRLAREVGLPVIIHCREAYADCLDELEAQMPAESGVMHCWGGSPAEAERAVSLGLYLGFGGSITFKSADETRAALREAPADRVLVETDAPYLAPVPHRGKRNEPAHARITLARMAEIRGMGFQEAAERTTANACRLFGK